MTDHPRSFLGIMCWLNQRHQKTPHSLTRRGGWWGTIIMTHIEAFSTKSAIPNAFRAFLHRAWEKTDRLLNLWSHSSDWWRTHLASTWHRTILGKAGWWGSLRPDILPIWGGLFFKKVNQLNDFPWYNSSKCCFKFNISYIKSLFLFAYKFNLVGSFTKFLYLYCS